MANSRSRTVIRDISPTITTFTTQFNRFAPFGYRKFVAVGNRATAIRLQNGKVLLLNPIQLELAVRGRLAQLGGVDYIACDLGHHMYVAEYVKQWPDAKTIGVVGLPGKRKDVKWDFVCGDGPSRPEEFFSFEADFETVFFEGFITYAVAWYHKPTQTLVVSDLLMNLPAREEYSPLTSADQGPASREFARRANPNNVWFRRLIYHVACVEYPLMRRDCRRVADWDIQRIVPCHGEVIDSRGNDAWNSVYQWFITGSARPGLLWRVKTPIMRVARRWFLM